ncbi:ABC transporter ATP-binding protein [soil metagenome]
MTEAIVFEDVSFTYPDADSPVLERASFALEQGCFALVTGATGSGKSTLLRAANGLVPHFSGGRMSGRVLAHGLSTIDRPPRRLSHLLAFVPQDPGASFVVDRVEDELAYALENLAVDAATMRRRVEETLDLMDIERLRDRSVRTLSGGERQRVAIASALTAGPRTLLLDEPTSQLDPQGAEDVLAALQRLVHDLGMTVVVAEHRLERVAGFVDVAIGCRAHRSPQLGAPAEILELVGSGPPVTALGRLVGWRPPPLTVRAARRLAPSLVLPPAPAAAVARERGGPLVEARGVVAGYGAPVLHGVEVELRAGEIVVLMGRNGAGKTTLLRCLAGLHAPDRGEVTSATGRPQPGRTVALCPQIPESILFLTSVAGEVQTSLDARSSALPARELLEQLGLGDLAEAHPRDVSAGERVLVAVAAVVATGAPALLLDEPTRGLDPSSKRRLASMLRAHARAGGGAMLATHDVELAAAVATRVVLLAGGEVIAEGSPQAVLGDSPVFAPQMARVFGPGWLTPEQVAGAHDGATTSAPAER